MPIYNFKFLHWNWEFFWKLAHIQKILRKFDNKNLFFSKIIYGILIFIIKLYKNLKLIKKISLNPSESIHLLF